MGLGIIQVAPQLELGSSCVLVCWKYKLYAETSYTNKPRDATGTSHDGMQGHVEKEGGGVGLETLRI